jgi:iron complex outermembrane receptor protein
MMRKHLLVLVPILLAGGAVCAADPVLDELSLEELVKLDVSTVARKAQKLSDTPAAVTILSAEDIRRSGARSIPEALREVPGVNVAQIGGSRWAVSVRGFNGRFSNKLLVQIDGRSIYSPLFSGVFWESVDILLEDVERIEVVRGPGASLWGANAVDGIINIVTRKATLTEGTLVSASVDDRGLPTVAARQGITLESGDALRVFAKTSEIAGSQSETGQSARDQGSGWLAGFRMDSALAGSDSWMLQGNSYRRSSADVLIGVPQFGGAAEIPLGLHFQGANLLGRYNWDMAGGAASIQAYFDHQQTDLATYGIGSVDTLDLDLQHRFAPSGAHEVMAGLGYRFQQTDIQSRSFVLWMTPERRDIQISSAFMQDEITLAPRRLKLTLGARFEYSNLSGFEPQPTVRLMWTPTLSDSLWASWSRAARTPSVGESDANILFGAQPTPPGTPFPLVALVSQPAPGWNRRAERVDAFELGYRRNLGNGSFEAVAFHQHYLRLIGESTAGMSFPGIPVGAPYNYLPTQNLYRGNNLGADSNGLETALDVPITSNFRLQASYTLMETVAQRSTDPATDAYGQGIAGGSPYHWASVHGLFSFGAGRELDLMLRRVGAISLASIPAYTAVDLRYAWKVSRRFEMSVVGQNLFDPLHLEYVSDFFPGQPAYQPRRGYIQGVWRF